MKIKDFVGTDICAYVQVFRGQWNGGGECIANTFGITNSLPKDVLESEIVYMTVDYEEYAIIMEVEENDV